MAPRTVSIIAPPGRLGLQLRTERRLGMLLAPPSVTATDDTSPLRGKVARGWALLSIDGYSTRRLNSKEACAELVRRSDSERTLLMSTDVTPGWSRLGATMVASINLFVCFVVAVFVSTFHRSHLLPTLGVYGATVFTAAWLAATLGGMYDYWRCILATPGYANNTLSCSAGDPMCAKCCWAKPRMARHCSSCDRCVLRMDHHCFWLDSCVGQENYRHFLRLELQLGAATFLSFAGCTCAVARTFADEEHRRRCIPWALLAGALVFILALLVRCIAMHIRLLYEGETTVGYLFRQSADELAPPAEADGTRTKAAEAWNRDSAEDGEKESVGALMGRLEDDVFGTGGVRTAVPGVSTVWFGLVLLYARSATFRAMTQRCAMH